MKQNFVEETNDAVVNLLSSESLVEQSTESVRKAVMSYMQFDAEEMENFHKMIANYWQRSIDEIDNMDAKKISSLLKQVALLIKNRTGN